MIEAVIFDFDGVILDSEHLHYQASLTALKPLGIALPYSEYVEHYAGIADKEKFPLILQAKNQAVTTKMIEQLISAKVEVYQSLLNDAKTLPVVSGLLPFLHFLSQHIDKLAICSGSSRKEIEHCFNLLEQGQLRKYFSVVTTIEDVHTGKPSGEGYLKTLSELAVEANTCLVIEDTSKGIQAAQNANLRVAALTTTQPLSKLSSADYIANNYQNLENWIKQCSLLAVPC